MPEEALHGDTEGRSRDDKKESEESEEQSDIARKKNSDSDVETSDENVKDVRVKCEVVDCGEVKEEDEDHDDDDDDDDYSESEDSWLNRVQKKRNEEEKDYVWIRLIDKETYVKVMTPLYMFLEVRSQTPLEVQQVRLAVSHLSRVWSWWGVGVRHRGQERTPWLCVAPTQRPILQVSGVEDDEDEDELWDLVDQQQWRHTKVGEGMLSSVTLITHPRLSAAAAAAADAPHTHRNENRLPAVSDSSGPAGGVPVPTTSTTTTTTTPCSGAACSGVQVKDVPDLPHQAYLMLGIPRPFVDRTTPEGVSRTLITLLDDVQSGRIQEEYKPAQESGSHGKDRAEGDSLGLESWLAEKLQVVVEAKAEGEDSNADPEGGSSPENEYDTRGHVQRTLDCVISRNFINRCKAERVSFVNGFATCVSTAAASFLLAAEAGEREEREQRVVTRQRVSEHLYWPTAPMEWQDGDPDEEPPPEPSNRPVGVTFTAPPGEDDSVFWEVARYISQQRWGSPAGSKKGSPLQILHFLPGEDSDDDLTLQRYPSVSLRLCDIQRGEGGAPSVQRVGDVVALGPYPVSPLRHFLITHTINMHLEEATQALSFTLHHSTVFLSPGSGRSFADEIETALKNSLRRR